MPLQHKSSGAYFILILNESRRKLCYRSETKIKFNIFSFLFGSINSSTQEAQFTNLDWLASQRSSLAIRGERQHWPPLP